ncbi:laccase domain-containing protein [Candidatus Saccharibacteria bacterium]|nr:laccase domain-containing protein [Candidatus Saccharibacteria bacterium]
MIKNDQPTCFPDDVLVALSSKNDGTMLDRDMGVHDGTIVSHRTKFCKKIGVDYSDVVYQRIIYSRDRTYRLICEVDDGSTTKWTSEVVTDALFTRSKNVALMLPVADCVATIIYDPVIQALSLLHLGRHSTTTDLLVRVLRKFSDEGSQMKDLIVWMSPNAHVSNYVMEYFDQANDPAWQDFHYKTDEGYHIDMQGFNARICQNQGISPDNIHVSLIDTVTNPDYFSHSAGDASGRFAVVAMMPSKVL